MSGLNSRELNKLTTNGYKVISRIENYNVWVVSKNATEYIMKKFANRRNYTKEAYYYDMLADSAITPQLKFHNNDLQIIIIEKMRPFEEFTKSANATLIDTIDQKISELHHLYGIAHGDLHFGNIVLDSNNDPYFIDFENAYAIHSHNWETELWMRFGFDWDRSYKDFVNHDYVQWRHDIGMFQDETTRLLYRGHLVRVDRPPNDYVSINDEYYVKRFHLDNYYLDGDCGSFAIQLKSLLGGEVYGLYETQDTIKNVPSHYVLKMRNGYFVDATGIYANTRALYKITATMLDVDSDGRNPTVVKVNQKTLNNAEYICEFTPELIQDAGKIAKLVTNGNLIDI